MIAAIQAGGKSQRMGRDKAWLEIGGEPLISRVLTVARQVVDRQIIVINSESENRDRYEDLARIWGAELLLDIHPGQGPLGGIETALLACPQRESALILACDLPYLSADFLSLLRRNHEQHLTLITVPVDAAGRVQPLAAIYSQGCLEVIREQVVRRRLRVDLLFDLVATHRVFARDYCHLPGSDRFFLNLNTPEDALALEGRDSGGDPAR